MYPLLYQVWVQADRADLQGLIEWWAGRHARSLLGAGFLGVHQYQAIDGGPLPLLNISEISGMEALGEVYHAATLADLPFLAERIEKYRATTEADLEHLRSSGSTATIYDQLAIHARPESERSVAVALSAPCLTTHRFGALDAGAVVDWFDVTFGAGTPTGWARYVDIRLTRKHGEQHPISPLPPDDREWMLLVQWPNRQAAEATLECVHEALEGLPHDPADAVTSDLVTNGVSLLNESAWG